MSVCMQHLLAAISRKGDDLGPAYLSLGNLALVMGPSIFITASSPTSQAARAEATGGAKKLEFNFQSKPDGLNLRSGPMRVVA
jgi:hypothetical protein